MSNESNSNGNKLRRQVAVDLGTHAILVKSGFEHGKCIGKEAAYLIYLANKHYKMLRKMELEDELSTLSKQI